MRVSQLMFSCLLATTGMGCSLVFDFDGYRNGGVGSADAGATDSSGDGSSDAEPGDATLACRPSPEECNDLDDDCDGIVDEGGFDPAACADACGRGAEGGEADVCEEGELCIAGHCGHPPFFMTAGNAHTCAVTNPGGRLYCWGSNSQGQVASMRMARLTEPTPVPSPAANVRHIAAGANHTCAIDYGFESPHCWGDNQRGQLGTVSGTTVNRPLTLPNVEDARSTFAGGASTCFLRGSSSSTGQLYCGGSNDDGQLGTGGTAGGNSFPISAGGRFFYRYQVEMGPAHACGLSTDDSGVLRIYCWGNGASGQLGLPVKVTVRQPRAVLGLSMPTSREWPPVLTTGEQHSCAIADSVLVCWGNNTSGQLGRGTSLSPAGSVDRVMLSGVPNIGPIAAGASHTCAASTDGRLFCWGDNEYGQLGVGLTDDQFLPVQVPLPDDASVTSLTAGARHTCAATARGLLYCWGDNAEGQLGIGTSGGIVPTPHRATGVH